MQEVIRPASPVKVKVGETVTWINETLKCDRNSLDNSAGIRPSYTNKIVPFNFNLFYREEDGVQSKIENDKGPLNLPKFFRKQLDYEALIKGFYMEEWFTPM